MFDERNRKMRYSDDCKYLDPEATWMGMTLDEQKKELDNLYPMKKRFLKSSLTTLRRILAIEGEYNTFQNDAMREVIEAIEGYLEEYG